MRGRTLEWFAERNDFPLLSIQELTDHLGLAREVSA